MEKLFRRSHICHLKGMIRKVGYGDMVPKTWAGKFIASILVFVSMVYLALPMTIIVSKFNKAFDKFKPENEKSAQRAPSIVPSVTQPSDSGVKGEGGQEGAERLQGQT